MLPTFAKWTLCKGLYGENDGPSTWRKWREKHIFNYNQMRAYVECSLNQPKIIPYRPFHRATHETLKIPEKCWTIISDIYGWIYLFSGRNSIITLCILKAIFERTNERELS